MATKPGSAPKYTHIVVPYSADEGFEDALCFAQAESHETEGNAITAAKNFASMGRRAAVFSITNVFGQVTKVESLWGRAPVPIS